MKNVLVIGGGPAGMMAAIQSKTPKNNVILLENNEKLGKKLYITGKGRCNLTNNSEKEDALKHVVRNSKFLFSAFNGFTPQDTMAFFEQNGLKLITERGNRVFPESGKASDVTKTLERVLHKSGVKIALNEAVKSIRKTDEGFTVQTTENTYTADSVVLATGGLSYPSTGSTGDGHSILEKMGHTVIPCTPSLCGIELISPIRFFEDFTAKNVVLTVKKGDKTLFQELGELDLVPYGFQGALTLKASALLSKEDLSDVVFYLDLKPALNDEVLDKRILRDFSECPKDILQSVLRKLLPKPFVLEVLKQASVRENQAVSTLSQVERKAVLHAVKNLKFIPKRLRPISEAIVTAGGVSVKEINPTTMESKLVHSLYVCGELLDVDAFTGGYNIQIALSTGYAAGNAVRKKETL